MLKSEVLYLITGTTIYATYADKVLAVLRYKFCGCLANSIRKMRNDIKRTNSGLTGKFTVDAEFDASSPCLFSQFGLLTEIDRFYKALA